jgi:lipopolysaccharide/colanic/teichoic acid biosynthesis glycosyltransferase
VIVAALGLIVCAPLFAIVALAILVSSPGSILFRQQRVGRNGQIFILVKFRTMKATRSRGPQVTAKDDTRITRVGRVLRATKIDELPELWNVLKGDMSLVGPRPEVPGYVDLSDPGWREVLKVRPGLTDPVTMRLRNEERLLAEVEGDVESFYLEKLQPLKILGYVEYLHRRSWREDVKVLFATVLAVVRPSSSPAPSTAQVVTLATGLAGKADTGQ